MGTGGCDSTGTRPGRWPRQPTGGVGLRFGGAHGRGWWLVGPARGRGAADGRAGVGGGVVTCWGARWRPLRCIHKEHPSAAAALALGGCFWA